MRNYIKGYTNRTRKRHSSRRRKESRRHRNSSQGSFVGVSALNEHRPERTSGLIRSVPKLAVGVVAAVVILAVMVRLFFFSGTGNDAADATGSSVTAAAAETTESSDQKEIYQAVAAVKELKADAVSTPAPVRRAKAVAFTFDDGPNRATTPRILATLKKYNAHATFFVVGTRVNAGKDILKQAISQGCEIGNHSTNHANLSKMTMKGVNKEYDKTAGLVKKLTGYTIPFLRPPYGAISNTMRKKLKHPMILWNVDTLDWKTRNTKKVFKEIKRTAADGNIILMHDLYPSTVKAVEKAVPWLQKHGYDILTVSELMKRKGIRLKNGKAYGSAK